ncbi:MAG: FlgB family protein [Sedimentitalea sp.]
MKLIEGEAPVFTNLTIFKTAHAMATHAGQRQALASQNVANSDTPGYQARDVEQFKAVFSSDGGAGTMRSSRAGHLNGATDPTGKWSEIEPDLPADPNDNTVSVELEILRAVEAKRQHDRAIAIYKSSLSILRTSLGRA